MDLSAIIVVIVLTALAVGAIVWMEIHSRRRQPDELSPDRSGTETRSGDPTGSVPENGSNRV